jgi:hypothetical protein
MAQPASETTITLPADDPSDSEEVSRSLKLARMLWEEGQLKEAVRALQRGAAAAEEVGNDMRALALARSAADLTALAGPSGPPPLPADSSGTTAAVPSVAAPAAPAAPRPGRALPTAPRAPSIKPDAKSADSSAGPAAPAVKETPPPPSVAPVAASIRPEPPSSSTVLSSAPPAQESPSSAAPLSTPTPARVAASGRISAAPAVAERRSVPSAARTNGAASSPFPVTGRELKVSVKRSALDENMFVVRPLGPGARLPPGAREAVLVFSDEE